MKTFVIDSGKGGGEFYKDIRKKRFRFKNTIYKTIYKYC